MFSNKMTTGVVDAFNSTLTNTVSTTKWLFSSFMSKPSTPAQVINEAKIKTKATAAFSARKHPVQAPSMPRMAQPFSNFQEPRKNDVRCFHQVFSVTQGLKKYFYKKNEPNSPMSELESYCRGAIDVIAHGNVPRAAIPVYNNNAEFIGLCSEAIPKFQSIIDAPFELADFKVRVMDDNILTIQQMKKLDKWARAHKINLHEIVKQKSISIDDFTTLESDLEDIAEKEKINLIQSVTLQEDWFKQADFDTEHPEKIYQIIQNVAQDLINFRYKMGFGIVFISRYIHAEDDLHRGNIGRGEMEDGAIDIVGIDYDMLMWEILYAHKTTNIFDKLIRNPSSTSFFRSPLERFNCTANDMSRLPDTQDASPFYKPTISVPMLPNLATMAITWLFGEGALEVISKNAFRPEDNKVFATLVDDPVFVHFKFKTFLKYIVTEPSMYTELAHLYLRDELMHDEEKKQKMTDALTAYEEKRLKIIKNELYKMGYDLELHYGQVAKDQAPKEADIQSNRIYLYVDCYGSIIMKAKNSCGKTEERQLTVLELGESFDSIKATLLDPKQPALSIRDKEILARATARFGYAQKGTMYEFKQFLREHGEAVKQEIMEEFNAVNEDYRKELRNRADPENKDTKIKDLIDIDSIEKACTECIAFADNVGVFSKPVDTDELQNALQQSVMQPARRV
jgi:hypothetical protein